MLGINMHTFIFQVGHPIYIARAAVKESVCEDSHAEFAMVIYKTKMGIVHIQCIDGSIMAGVFLTSYFCVVPESSGSSNAANSSLFVHVELGT